MKKVVIIIALVCLFSFDASANTYDYQMNDDTSLYDQMYEDYNVNELENGIPDEFSEFSDDLGISPSDPFSLSNLFSKDGFESFLDYLKSYIMSPLKSAGIMLVSIVVCALANSLSDNSLGVSRTLNTTAVLICTVSFMVPLSRLISKSVNTITTISTFMIIFIPIFAGILIACIRSSTAVGFQTILFFVCQAVTSASTYIVLPFTNCYIAVSLASGICENGRLRGISAMLKKGAFIVVSAVMAVFLAVLSVQNAVAGVADTTTTKTAKFFISSFVPIIGPSVSEALGSLKSCVTILKSSVGIYAVIVILFICIPIIIEILLYKLALSFCSSAASVFGVMSVKEISQSLSGALSIVLSVVICVSLMFIFAITVVSVAGGSV